MAKNVFGSKTDSPQQYKKDCDMEHDSSEAVYRRTSCQLGETWLRLGRLAEAVETGDAVVELGQGLLQRVVARVGGEAAQPPEQRGQQRHEVRVRQLGHQVQQ